MATQAEKLRGNEDLIELMHMVLERRRHSLDSYADKRAQFLDDFDLYMTQRNDPFYEWESNLVLPVVFDAVETHLPHVVAEDLQFHVSARRGADPNNARLLDAVVAYDVEKSGLPWKVVGMAKQALMYGTAPVETSYMIDQKLMRVRSFKEVFEGTGLQFQVPTTEEQMVTRYEGPWFESPDIMSILPQPGKDRVNGPGGLGMDWIIKWFTIPLESIELMEQNGVVLKGATEAVKNTSFHLSSDEYSDKQEREEVMGLSETKIDSTIDVVEILAMWGDRGKHGADGLVWVANRELVIRNEELPYFHGDLPFDFVQDIPVPNQLYGLGEARILKMYQEEKSDLRNSRLDNVHQVTNKMWTMVRGTQINPNELVSRPGGIIRVGSHSDIEQLQQSDVPFSTVQEEQLLQEDIERTAGQLDVLRGQRLGGDRASARESQLIADFAAARTKIKLMGFKKVLNQVGKWFVQLEQQFMTEEKVVRMNLDGIGEVDVRVTPEQIAGEWDVTVALEQALPMTRAQKKQDAEDLVNLLGPLVGEVVVPDPLVRKVLEAYNVDNIDEYLVSQAQAAAQATSPEELATGAVGQAQSIVPAEGAVPETEGTIQ